MNKKIIIIGAGVSGLSSGIYARKYGYETLILEKHFIAGGNLTGWKRKNCYIDNCVHWLNGSKKDSYFFKLWNEIDAFNNITFYQSENFLVSEYNFKTIALNKNINKTHKDMLLLSPNDHKEIYKFIKATKLIASLNEKNKFGQIKTIIDLYMLYKKSTLKDVAKKFTHPLLKKIFSDYFLDEYSIYAFLFAYASFISGDGKVPYEGSKKIAENILNTYLNLGGKIQYKSEVKQILYENKKVVGVKLNNGEKIKCDYVICATDPYTLFNNLLNDNIMPKNLQKTYQNKKDFPVISSFHIAYKITTDIIIPDSFVFELSEKILIGSTYYSRIMLKNYKYGKNFTNDNGFILQVFLLQSEKDYDVWASLNDEMYKQEKQRIIKTITTEIIKRFKKLKDNIEILDSWTPKTYNQYFNSYKGSYMSFGLTKKLKGLLYPYKCKNIDNLYFASSWQHLFGGLPNALISGKNVIDEINKNYI